MDRRDFMKVCAMATAALPAAAVLRAKALSAAAEETLGDEKLVKGDADPVAKALKYTADASKAAERKDARSGVAAKDQTCSNCALYTKAGKLKSGGEAGKCTMIQGGLVKSGGWCTSWSKKA